MTPKISIIIPCYNAETYLVDAINSILNQTYKNLEIICIDDGSTDNTSEILKSFLQVDERIKVYKNEKNLKLIQTLNKGIDIASGEYIARMDADDIAYPEKFEKQIRYLIDNNLQLCGTYTYFLFSNNNRKKHKTRAIHNNSIKLTSLFDSPLIHPTVLGESFVFKQNKYIDSPKNYLIEDFELWQRMLNQNIRIGVLPEFLFEYRINPAGVSQSQMKLQKMNHLQLISKKLNDSRYEVKHKSIQLISGIVIDKIFLKDLFCAVSSLKKIYFNFKKNTELSRLEIKELRRWYIYKFLYIVYSGLKSN